MSISESPAENTDREIWRERPGDFYSDSIHVTREGNIGINCGGHVFVMPARKWHQTADGAADVIDALVAASPDLSAVITWLENGCDPKHAATELRMYKGHLDAALALARKGD